MAKQGNILSFDEARVKARVARPSVSAPKQASGKPSVKKPSKRTPEGAPKTANRPSASTKKSAKPPTKQSVKKPNARKAAAVSDSHKKPVQVVKSKTIADGRKRTPTQRLDSKKNPKPAEKRAPSDKGQGKRVKTSPRNSASLKAANPKEKTAPQENKGDGTRRISKFTEIKREYAKGKAGREFTKQFGDTTSSAASTGPRAALYKGEMGRQHRKATQMQGSLQNPAGSKKLSTRFDWRDSPKFLATLMVAVCLVISGAFLYPSAKQYYVTVRAHDQLAAEYAAVQQRNDDMQDQVDALSTPEGIEDRARAEFGWVKEGENAVNVYGLASSQAEITYRSTIPAGSVEAPDTWYSPILDVIFGIS